jgi:hypothetical protein
MKVQIAILFVFVALLLASSAAMAQSGGQSPPRWYAVERGTTSGGGYRLTSLTWQVSGAASGAGFHLLGPAKPASSENGCCCTFLPCVIRLAPSFQKPGFSRKPGFF